jgi:hypothetical protein
MNLGCLLFGFFLLPFLSHAQADPVSFLPGYTYENNSIQLPGIPKRKLLQRNSGAIIGLQRGAGTAIEFGAEAHWRKLSLSNSRIVGATTNLEYNFSEHIIGYKLGAWMKQGRVNLTYGGNLVYFSDFEGGQKYGLGPAVGFRLAGFHLVNGYNFLVGDKDLKGANTLYMSLRYYFPVDNKFTWDRKTMKKKRERKREKEKRQDKREKEREKNGPKGIEKLFDFKKKSES